MYINDLYVRCIIGMYVMMNMLNIICDIWILYVKYVKYYIYEYIIVIYKCNLYDAC